MRELPPAASEVLRQVRQAHDPSAAEVARSLSRLQGSLSFGVDAAQAAAQVAESAATAPPHLGAALLTAKAIKLCVVVVVLSGSITGAMLSSRAPALPVRTDAVLATGSTATKGSVEPPEPVIQRDEVARAPNEPSRAASVLEPSSVPVHPESPRAMQTTERVTRTGTPLRARRSSSASMRARVEEAPNALHRETRPNLNRENPLTPVPAVPVASEGIAPPSQETTPSELDLISRAATSLRDGQLSRALSLLDAHRTLYPAGLLRTEQQGLRVLTLCGLGQVEQAGQLRREFLRDAGRTPLAARVRRACTEPGQP